MVRILMLGVMALLATVPSALIASLYLRRRGIDAPMSATVSTFMEVAPTPWKLGLVALNFVNFILFCGGGMAFYTWLEQ